MKKAERKQPTLPSCRACESKMVLPSALSSTLSPCSSHRALLLHGNSDTESVVCLAGCIVFGCMLLFFFEKIVFFCTYVTHSKSVSSVFGYMCCVHE